MTMSSRTPLVLLPGLLCDEALWQNQVQGLADIADVQVADLTHHSTISALADRVLAYAPEYFALAGLSMGGYVALEIMRRAPGRIGRLALLDTSARQDTPERRETRQGLIELAEQGRFLGVGPRMLPTLIHKDHREGPIGEAVIAMSKRVGKEVFIRQQAAIMGRVDSLPSLSKIEVPTLIVVGMEDQLTPLSEAEEMLAHIPHATLEVIPHCGHLPPLEAPEATNSALRKWLLG